MQMCCPRCGSLEVYLLDPFVMGQRVTEWDQYGSPHAFSDIREDTEVEATLKHVYDCGECSHEFDRPMKKEDFDRDGAHTDPMAGEGVPCDYCDEEAEVHSLKHDAYCCRSCFGNLPD